jgi:hypothetical protein
MRGKPLRSTLLTRAWGFGQDLKKLDPDTGFSLEGDDKLRRQYRFLASCGGKLLSTEAGRSLDKFAAHRGLDYEQRWTLNVFCRYQPSTSELVSEALEDIASRPAGAAAPTPLGPWLPDLFSASVSASEAMLGELDSEGATSSSSPKKKRTRWSKPDFPKQWARVFRVSRNEMVRWLKDGKIRNIQVSPRKYRIAVEDLPPGYRE